MANGRWFHSNLGPLSITLLRHYDEWRVSTSCAKEHGIHGDEGKSEDLPDTLEWQRWDCHDDDSRICLTPALPNLPVIAKPNTSLSIAPGGNALFYIGIPMDLEIQGECGGNLHKLISIPSETLSKTWHGDRSAGEVCYSLKTRARRNFDPSEWLDHDIIISVDLHNESQDTFEFERLFLDLGHFSIFSHEKRLWTNACRIRITENDEEGNDITYDSTPISPADSGQEVSPAREGKTSRSTLRRAFASVIDVIH